MSKIITLVKLGQEYDFEFDLSKDKETFIEIRDKQKYHFQFTWENMVGAGSVAIYASNDGIHKTIMNDGLGNDLSIDISTTDGNDFISDYVGHVSRYLGIVISGFTGGTIKGKIFFK